MRVLMVGPYPPARDGIANYAVQEVIRLRRDGHDVEVLSPGPSAAHHHLDLRSRRGPLALGQRLGSYDRVIVQFHPDVFYPAGAGTARHVATSLGLAAAFSRGPDVEVRVHEADYSLRPGSARALAMGAMWRRARRVAVHTEDERRALTAVFRVDPGSVEVAGHGSHFFPRTRLDRSGARSRVGLPADSFVFLAIGFIQPHKGFDRAIRALGTFESSCRLEVVGSVRLEAPEYLDHLDELRALAAATPGVTLREGYVSDELFDVWLVAADVVVLPYRHIWSSGVAERAALFDRPVIATRVGGLASQGGARMVLVDDDVELAAAMQRVAAAHVAPLPAAEADWPVERGQVMAEVRSRAAVARRREGFHRPLREPFAGASAPPDGSTEGVALSRMAPLHLPAPAGRPVRRAVKRLVRRLTAWQVDPIVAHVNRLHRASLQAVQRLGRQEDGGHDRGGPPATLGDGSTSHRPPARGPQTP